MPEQWSRRLLLKNLLGAAAAGMASPPLQGLWLPQGGQLTGLKCGEMGRLAAAFKSSFRVPALSVAIARNGQFVFDQGFGFNQGLAQRRPGAHVEPVSDCGIDHAYYLGHDLYANRTRQTESHRQGLRGIRNSGTHGKSPYKQYVTDITVDHLLTHTCGGWPDDSTDPMFRFNSWDQAKAD